MAQGLSLRSISIRTGINRATLRDWREHPEKSVNPRRICPGCADSPTLPEPQADYAYLLGLYPGDGCISRASARGKQGQRTIVVGNPGHFARGLLHSDGYRGMNRVRAHCADGDRWYEYPRYLFTNESRDILRLCGETLDQLGVSWRFSKRNTISVARREAVARLDEFAGPKY